MNACINCGQCLDTGCMCVAKVAKSKPVDGGNVQFPEVEIEPAPGWETALVWGCILVMVLCSTALIATGLIYLYQDASNFLKIFFN